MGSIERNKTSSRVAKTGNMGAAVGVEPLSDEEAISMREEFGYILRPTGKTSSKSSGVHIPKERGSMVPMCDEVGQVEEGVEFVDKDDKVFPHGYVRESAYSYCDHCVRVWRKHG